MMFPNPESLPLEETTEALVSLLTSTEALKHILDLVKHPVFVKDSKHRFILANDAMLTLCGFSREDLIGKTAFEIHQEEESETFLAHDIQVFETGIAQEREVPVTAKDGTVRTVVARKCLMHAGPDRTPFLVAVVIDITPYREAEKRNRFLATHDTLTALPNRLLFAEKLAESIERSRSGDDTLALLVVDIDGFKSINDLHGHAAGDGLLKAVADRLSTVTRETDTVARLGGDEFAIILRGGDQRLRTRDVAKRIGAVLNSPVESGDDRITTTVSIGIAIFSADVSGNEDLMHRADVALYDVKRSGRANFRFFDPAMEMNGSQRLERDLRLALQRGQLHMAYQPIWRAADGILMGYEALMRWRHPVFGDIAPAVFIPIAERTKMIEAFGEFALNEACAMAAGQDTWRIAVNVSPVQLGMGHLMAHVTAALRQSGLRPDRLELEITENTVARELSDARDTFAALKTLGVGIALDDFGKSNASLGMLMAFPVDRIKIDGRFVADLPRDGRAMIIVEGIARIAKQMGTRVTAEGVETRAQLTALQTAGVDEIQGFLTGRPSLALTKGGVWTAYQATVALADVLDEAPPARALG